MVLIHLFRNESGKKTSLFYILRLTFFLFLFVISPFSVQYIHAAEVTLAWDQNSEPDIAGYRIYYGQESRSYTNVVDVGNYTSCVVADLEDGQTYYFAATAYNTDNYESEYSNEVSYTGSSTDIINEPPVADAGHEQTVAEGIVVTISGVNSSDPDDGIASYEWTLISGPYVKLSGATTPEAVFIAPEVEANGVSLTFALTVTDYSGQSSTGTCIVNVTAVNDPPTAYAGHDQTISEGSTVILNGSNSTDPDDGIATFEWSQTDGPLVTLSSTSAVQPRFTAPDVGSAGASLVFHLTVTDNGGLQSTDSCVVNVTSNNNPPVADVGSDQTVNEGSIVTLDATNSYDYDGTIVSYLWKQVGGIPVTLSNPMAATPTFTAPAVNWEGDLLTFELTVTDDGGLQSTDSCTVTVSDSISQQITVEDVSNKVIFVSSVDSQSINQRNKWTAAVTIVISGTGDVSGAVVRGTWSDGADGFDLCTADANGMCSVSYSGIPKKVKSVTFTITGIQSSSLTYDPNLNAVDSIVISKP